MPLFDVVEKVSAESLFRFVSGEQLTGFWILGVDELLSRVRVSSDVLEFGIALRVGLAVRMWVAVAAPFKA